jgi:hypothetical protein
VIGERWQRDLYRSDQVALVQEAQLPDGVRRAAKLADLVALLRTIDLSERQPLLQRSLCVEIMIANVTARESPKGGGWVGVTMDDAEEAGAEGDSGDTEKVCLYPDIGIIFIETGKHRDGDIR